MKKILIADDEPHVARVIRLVLENEGYHVTYVCNGQEALDVFDELHPDVLIADVKMPKVDGRQLVGIVREHSHGKDIPIIVMTSSLETRHRDWLSDMHNTFFIGKPASPRELVNVINNFFKQHGDAADPEIDRQAATQ
jgi:DNA-binding response OmpR family regulator